METMFEDMLSNDASLHLLTRDQTTGSQPHLHRLLFFLKLFKYDSTDGRSINGVPVHLLAVCPGDVVVILGLDDGNVVLEIETDSCHVLTPPDEICEFVLGRPFTAYEGVEKCREAGEIRNGIEDGDDAGDPVGGCAHQQGLGIIAQEPEAQMMTDVHRSSSNGSFDEFVLVLALCFQGQDVPGVQDFPVTCAQMKGCHLFVEETPLLGNVEILERGQNDTV